MEHPVAMHQCINAVSMLAVSSPWLAKLAKLLNYSIEQTRLMYYIESVTRTIIEFMCNAIKWHAQQHAKC